MRISRHSPSGTTVLLAALTVAACAAASTLPEPLPGPHRRVLFVGNSLTYYNNLPATVGAIATLAGDTMQISQSTGSGLALIDHLTGGSDAVDQLKSHQFDYVVLQQGPTTTGGPCRDSLVLWSRMFDSLIRPTGGRAALFMPWPAIDQGDVWAPGRIAYQLAAQAVDGAFLPAGEAWHIALAAHPGLLLYYKDRSHPAALGSYLAALEIYERLSGRDARTLPTTAFDGGVVMPLGADTVRWLQQAAHQANLTYPAFGTVENLPAPDTRPPGSNQC